MDSFLKKFRIQLFSKVSSIDMSLCSPLKFGICDIYNMFCVIHIQYFTQNLFTLYVNSIQYDHLIRVEAIIIMFFNEANVYLTLENLILFCY